MLTVAFTGARRLRVKYYPLVSRCVKTVEAANGQVLVGCARGLDQMVRKAATRPKVFEARSGLFGDFEAHPAQTLANRSKSMVYELDMNRSCERVVLIGFVDKPCPPSVRPAPHWCPGSGSGTWATLALAAGLGIPIMVIWPGASDPALPAWWGTWAIPPVIGGSVWDQAYILKKGDK